MSYTYDLGGRKLGYSDTAANTIALTNDTAGRLTGVSTTMPGLSGALSTAYLTMISACTPTFESRPISQSHEHEHKNGNVFHEPNSWPEIGDTAVNAHGDTEATVVKSRDRNPLTCEELVAG